MNVADAVLIEKIERLAFMAGASSKQAEQLKVVPPQIMEAIRRMKMALDNNMIMNGDALMALRFEDNFRWEDARILVPYLLNEVANK